MPRVDVHAHLAGVGTGGSGCWVAPRFRRRWSFLLLRRLVGLRGDEPDADARYAARLAALVRAAGLDAAVALGFDAVVRPDGTEDPARTALVVPPAWVFAMAARHPELVPGPSIHPYRRDALARLDEAIDRGAVLIKWLPATQGMDPADARLAPFYRRLADAGVALLVHVGGKEHVLPELEPQLHDPERLRRPLEHGVIVVAAHSGAPAWPVDPDRTDALRRLLRAYPNLWLDNSGLATPSRARHLLRFARDDEIAARTLYGSDYPVPSWPLLAWRRLGRRALTLQRDPNPVRRDLALKRALGYPPATETRAAVVLPALARALTGR
jgi:predicted TIM-barrel fold metal-dependent hydrolase